jgi:sarcosine oxidase, subunit beta
MNRASPAVTTQRPYQVIVIGGGLAGASTAYFLAADGVSTLLLERDDLNSQASGTNAGSLHAQIPVEPFVLEDENWRRGFGPVVRFLAAGIELWRTVPHLLDIDIELQLNGGLIAASTDQQMEMLEKKVALERRNGLEVELLDRSALLRIAPYLSERIVGGTFCPREGKANPLIVTPAFAAAAERCGASVVRHTEVTEITRKGSGYWIDTTNGVFEAEHVVNAAGAQAGRIAQMVGVSLGIEGHPIQVTVTEPAEALIPHLVYYAGEKLSLKQTPRGAFLIGGGWPARLDGDGRPVVDPVSLTRNLAMALEVVPSIGSVQIYRSWAAIVNGTKDWRPILGEQPEVPGFFMNFVPWLGFTGGPIASRIIANWVQGREAGFDFDVDQFRR